MVAPSKVFDYPLNRLHCAHVLHNAPQQSCTEAFVWNLYRYHLSSAKYYLPVLLVPLVFNWRKQSTRRAWLTLKNYLQTSSFASIINAGTFYLMCIFRRLNGYYVCSCTPFISCYLASQVVWWAPYKVRQFYVTGITHAALEGMMRQLDLSVVHSRPTQTLIFMVCSLLVLRQQQAKLYSGFWFIRPAMMPPDYSKWSLGRRLKQGLLELRTYLGIGLALDLINSKLNRKSKQLQLKSTSFMLCYMGIYKAVQCLLADRLELRYTNLLAAFLSGASFGLVRRIPLTFMALAMVIASQVLWQQFCALDVSNNEALAALQRIPWAQLLIPPNLAYLVHNLIFHQNMINGLAKAFINGTCDKNAQRIHDLLDLPVETILSTVQSLPRTPFLL